MVFVHLVILSKCPPKCCNNLSYFNLPELHLSILVWWCIEQLWRTWMYKLDRPAPNLVSNRWWSLHKTRQYSVECHPEHVWKQHAQSYSCYDHELYCQHLCHVNVHEIRVTCIRCFKVKEKRNNSILMNYGLWYVYFIRREQERAGANFGSIIILPTLMQNMLIQLTKYSPKSRKMM